MKRFALLALVGTLAYTLVVFAGDPFEKGNAIVRRLEVVGDEVAKKEPIKFDPSTKGTGYIPLTPEKRAMYQAISRAKHGGRIAMLAQFQTIPAAFDCREKGWVTPVGDQGQCGSCYLYSTCQTASAAFVKAGYGKPDGSFMISVQFGMDCHDFGGCNGGNGTEVIDWMCKNGFPCESWVDTAGKTIHDYPAYTANTKQCRLPANAKIWKPADWGFVNDNGRPTPAEIKTAMFNYGTLNLAIDAGGQFGNGTGTITSLGRSIDHEIQCIAWDDAKDGGSFLLQNQWDTNWGVNGYRWVTYKAAANIVDWFFVTATPLPPPPPPVPPLPPVPPVPPGPGPTPDPYQSLIITVPGKYWLVPEPKNDADKVQLIRTMFQLTGARELLPPLVPTTDDARWASQEKVNGKIADALQKITERLDALAPKKP